jgi:aminoglycoside phosphotransferase (APT) family kinase protein
VRKADISVELVSCLVTSQFPQWSALEIRPVALDGCDNTTFRLGDDMSVRIPSHEIYVPQIDKEHRWLPVLASQLPLPIPQPIAKGAPGCRFPVPWSIYGWLDGEHADVARVADEERLAEDLGRFLTALQRVTTDGGPPAGAHSFNRGGPVSTWDDQTRGAIAELGDEIDQDGALAVWEAALVAEWNGPDVWVHGDVTGSNLLVGDDRLCGVIDFGCAAVGDPACDLTAAWTMFEGTSRQRFQSAVPADAGTWARARGWAVWKALIEIAGRPADDPGRTGARFGWKWNTHGVIDQAIADLRSSSGARSGGSPATLDVWPS